MAKVTRDVKNTWTRRALVGCGIACAAAYAVPRKASGEYTLSTASHDEMFGIPCSSFGANLYAFPGAPSGATVVAVTWPATLARLNSRTSSVVQLRAGSRSWSVKVDGGATRSCTWEEDRCRFFTGRIFTRPTSRTQTLEAVVMEAPREQIAGTLGIWAERRTPSSRCRFGSPFLSALVAGDRSFKQRYHSICPAQDKQLLESHLAEAISVRARANPQLNNPDSYGRRLASALLPDTLRYDTELPFGFTFAAQNGRHPEEALQDVVLSVLTGSSLSGHQLGVSCGARFDLRPEFPYFRQVASAV